jgi:hypothetical protein
MREDRAESLVHERPAIGGVRSGGTWRVTGASLLRLPAVKGTATSSHMTD